ncbi:MAG: hypothetical protein ACLPR9_06520 [Acidimicrobiales bacterium]|jgi:hypothetical protein
MKGSRRKLRPGVWELRVHAGTSSVTGKPKYVSRTFHGSPAKSADDALSELVTEVATTDHTGPAESFGAYLDRWLPKMTVLKELSPTTVRENKRTIEKIIKPALGGVPLRDLGVNHLDDLYVALRSRERPLSPASVRRGPCGHLGGAEPGREGEGNRLESGDQNYSTVRSNRP